MKSNDFINEFLKEEVELNFNQSLEKNIIMYERYTYYLKLLRHSEVIEIFRELVKNKTIYKALLNNRVTNHKFKYYVNILRVENLIETDEPSEEFIEPLVLKYKNSSVVEGFNFFKLSDKGDKFLSNRFIKKLIIKEEKKK